MTSQLRAWWIQEDETIVDDFQMNDLIIDTFLLGK